METVVGCPDKQLSMETQTGGKKGEEDFISIVSDFNIILPLILDFLKLSVYNILESL